MNYFFNSTKTKENKINETNVNDHNKEIVESTIKNDINDVKTIKKGFLDTFYNTILNNLIDIQSGRCKITLTPHSIHYLKNKMQEYLDPQYSINTNNLNDLKNDYYNHIQSWKTKSTNIDSIENTNLTTIEPNHTNHKKLIIFKLSTLILEICSIKIIYISEEEKISKKKCKDFGLILFPNLKSIEINDFLELSQDHFKEIDSFSENLEVLIINHAKINSLKSIFYVNMEKITNKMENNENIDISYQNNISSVSNTILSIVTNKIKTTFILKWIFLHTLKIRHADLNDLNQEDEIILNRLKNLIKIDFSNNHFKSFNGLSIPTSTKYLNIGYNKLSTIQNIQSLKNIETLILYNNTINELQLFKECLNLRHFDISHNMIQEISEIQHLKSLKRLKNLILTGNPFKNPYRQYVLETLGDEIILDNIFWSGDERNKYGKDILTEIIEEEDTIDTRKKYDELRATILKYPKLDPSKKRIYKKSRLVNINDDNDSDIEKTTRNRLRSISNISNTETDDVETVEQQEKVSIRRPLIYIEDSDINTLNLEQEKRSNTTSSILLGKEELFIIISNGMSKEVKIRKTDEGKILHDSYDIDENILNFLKSENSK